MTELPPGFVLDRGRPIRKRELPPLPKGFVLDEAQPSVTSMPTLAKRAQQTFGFDPNLQRMALVPRAKTPQGEEVWAMPQIGVDIAQSALLPGHVYQGGAYSPEDVVKMAMDVTPMRSAISSSRLSKRQFIEKAPAKETLKKQSRALYKDVKTRGIVIPGVHSKQLVANMGAQFREMGASPALHKKATGLMDEWAKWSQVDNPPDMDFMDLEIMRRQALNLGRDQDPGEAMFGGVLRDAIDDYVGRMDIPNIKKARALWLKNIKMQDVEEILFKAEISASGFENGLRTGFRALLRNKKTRKKYSPDEIKAMKKVVNGGPVRAFLRTIRHLGPGTGTENRYLGSMMGMGGGYAVGNIPGALAVGGLGHMAGRAAERTTDTAARLAEAMIASGVKHNPESLKRILGRALAGPTLGTQVLTPEQERQVRSGGII